MKGGGARQLALCQYVGQARSLLLSKAAPIFELTAAQSGVKEWLAGRTIGPKTALYGFSMSLRRHTLSPRSTSRPVGKLVEPAGKQSLAIKQAVLTRQLTQGLYDGAHTGPSLLVRSAGKLAETECSPGVGQQTSP